MKNLLLLAACALLASPLHAETTLVEEMRAGFVHLLETDGNQKTDIYLNPSQIAAVTLYDFGNGNFEVLVMTTAPAPAPVNGVRYTIDFTDKEKAQGCVNKILGIMRQAAGGGGKN